MQKARRHIISMPRPLVSVWFQVLFTPLRTVLFTFPSRYLFTIGLSGVFSLGRWCCQIQTGFLRPRLTQVQVLIASFTHTGLSPCIVEFPTSFQFGFDNYVLPYNPMRARKHHGLGWSPFARHYLGNHFCFLFLRVLRCFSSPRWPLSVLSLQLSGLPHSDIYGLTLTCKSPQLFAAYHVLLRL